MRGYGKQALELVGTFLFVSIIIIIGSFIISLWVLGFNNALEFFGLSQIKELTIFRSTVEFSDKSFEVK